jgi:hypothetical protein
MFVSGSTLSRMGVKYTESAYFSENMVRKPAT